MDNWRRASAACVLPFELPLACEPLVIHVCQVQGTCVNDIMQGVSGIAALVAATTIWSEAQDLSAADSAMMVYSDSYVGQQQQRHLIQCVWLLLWPR